MEEKEIIKEPISARDFGKTTKALQEFWAHGKLGQAVIFATPEGNFLSPKAVKQALNNQIDTLVGEVEKKKKELPSTPCEICDRCERGLVCEERKEADKHNQALDDTIKLLNSHKEDEKN